MTKYLVLVMLIGCGGGGSHGDVALADLGTQIGASYCAKEFACCTDAEIMMDFGSFKVGGQPVTTEAQCETFYHAFFDGLVTAMYMDSLAKGRISYDGEAAGACLAAIDDLSCPAFGAKNAIDNSSGCKQFLVPQVDDGGACAQGYECKHANCVGASTNPATDGTCMPLPGAGEMCDFDCAAGLFCDFQSSKCVATKANGETCSGADQCTSDFCDQPTQTTSGTCADRNRCDGR